MFNDGAFAALTEKGVKDSNQIRLQDGQPIRFGLDGERGVVRDSDGSLKIIDAAQVDEEALVVHDPTTADGGLAYSLARLADDPSGPTPIGIFRDVSRPVYGRGAGSDQSTSSEPELDELLHAGDSWTIA